MCKVYDSLKRWIFNLDLKIDIVPEDLIWSGSPFHKLETATEKYLSPYVLIDLIFGNCWEIAKL